MTPRSTSDPLDDETVWHDLIMDYVQLPMNYGANIGGVRPLARAAGIDPHRAAAKVLAYYHHGAHRGACNESCKAQRRARYASKLADLLIASQASRPAIGPPGATSHMRHARTKHRSAQPYGKPSPTSSAKTEDG